MPNVIVVLEAKDAQALHPACLRAIAFGRAASQSLGATLSLLLIGHELGDLIETARHYGADQVYVVDSGALTPPHAEKIVPTLLDIVVHVNATVVVAAATTFGKDVSPRLAELLDAAYVSECIGFEATNDGILWRRPISAGNAVAYCKTEPERTVVSVRHTEFEPASFNIQLSPVEYLQASKAEQSVDRVESIRFAPVENLRPDIAEARIVVSGGRPLGSRYFQVLGPLADALGAGLGATRAICDGGYAPADLQVGQTGKVVSPDLYLAVGISGAIQHLSGIKGARVVVAINSDPEAPIVATADYALIGDLFTLVPELVQELHRRKRES